MENWKETYKKFIEENYKEKFQREGNLSSTNRLNWGCEECGGEDAEQDIENFIEQIISERDKEWRMALEENRGETKWGEAGENSIMEISLHNFINAVLKQITNTK